MGVRLALPGHVSQCLRALPGVEAGLVAAVSGGPDSVALLRALLQARPQSLPLVVAHFNHQLRGNESDADEKFVATLYAELRNAGAQRLELCLGRCDIAQRARQERGNIEAVARRERYRWLAQVAEQTRAAWVATGHTADDQAETLLLRLLRGTGLQGLRGIAARRPLQRGVALVRPLLDTTRAEVLTYLKSLGQSYCQDVSNQDPRRTRNRIRHDLLPQLVRDFNPAIVTILGRLASQAAECFSLAEAEAAALLSAAQRPSAGRFVVLDRQVLAVAPRHRAREAFRALWSQQGWPVAAMGLAAWDRLAGLARGDTSGVDLPGGLRARLRERVIVIGKKAWRPGP